MSSPIFDELSANIEALKTAAYKRGHLQAQVDMLAAIKTVNTDMISAEQLFQQIINLLADIKTPTKAPKTRTKKVAK